MRFERSGCRCDVRHVRPVARNAGAAGELLQSAQRIEIVRKRAVGRVEDRRVAAEDGVAEDDAVGLAVGRRDVQADRVRGMAGRRDDADAQTCLLYTSPSPRD